MSAFTYETKNNNVPLETYEWDNVWLEQTEITDRPRVLYIGDSISCGIRQKASAAAEYRVLIDGFGSSKALDNPYLPPAVSLFGRQQNNRAAILVNNGLHGWHLEDTTEYRQHYDAFLCFLEKEFPATPIFVVTTTRVENEERHARVLARNKVAKELAQAHGMPCFDLYPISVEQKEHQIEDGVHYTREGYVIFAKAICAFLKEQNIY